MAGSERTDLLAWALGVFAVVNLANGVWMLAAPADWYARLPAAVPDTGPLNEHFVRDVGSAFVMMGCALVAGALRPALRAPALAFVALFYVLHALVHVADTLTGRLPASHWLIDLPGVYLPAALLVALAAVAARRPAPTAGPSGRAPGRTVPAR
jgi:hypothetical protein